MLSLLDADERATRLAACWTITLVVDTSPATAEPVARRLLDRLADGESSLEVCHAFSYLRHRFPDAVDEALLRAAEEADSRYRRRRYLELSPGFVRSDYYDASPGDREVGRTRIPSRAGPTDSRQQYRVEGHDIGGAPAEKDSRPPRRRIRVMKPTDRRSTRGRNALRTMRPATASERRNWRRWQPTSGSAT